MGVRWRCLASFWYAHTGLNVLPADKGGEGWNVKIHEAEVMFELLQPDGTPAMRHRAAEGCSESLYLPSLLYVCVGNDRLLLSLPKAGVAKPDRWSGGEMRQIQEVEVE